MLLGRHCDKPAENHIAHLADRFVFKREVDSKNWTQNFILYLITLFIS
jgi:hypothetical protein